MTTADEILRHEFAEGEGSFLIQLRTELHWDRDAFTRLANAMYEYAKAKDSKDRLDPDIAQGYWFLERFVPEWTSHENFPRPASPYYEDCLMRISDLADFYFIGESPYLQGAGFDPI